MVTKVLRWGLVTSVASLVSLCAASCATIAGLDQEFRPAGDTGGGAAGGDGGGAATTTTNVNAGGSGAGGGTACVLAKPPGPPVGAEDGGDIEILAAVHTIQLDEMDFAPTLGLDLDDTCSCLDGAPQTCTQVADPVCDGPGGLDNALGKIFATVYDFSSTLISSGQISKAAGEGRWSSLLRVTGYNGLPDDPSVVLSVYQTPGFPMGANPPLWDGNDLWPVDTESLGNPPDLESVLIKSTEAYVTNNVLVARVDRVPLRIRSGLFTMDIDLYDVITRVTLEKLPSGGYRMIDGVLAGKWLLSGAFSSVSSIRFFGNSVLCTDDNDYFAVKTAICSNADVRQDGMPGACDALSFGATFTADPAKLGLVTGSPPLEPGCDPDVDPAMDSCD